MPEPPAAEVAEELGGSASAAEGSGRRHEGSGLASGGGAVEDLTGAGFGSGSGSIGRSGGGSRVPVLPETVVAAPTPDDPVQRFVDGLATANIAFNPPKTMVMGDRKLVELLMSVEQSQAALRAQLPVEDQGSAQTATAKVAPRMEATLTGVGFTVESLSPSEQAVSRSQQTQWSWAVTPTAPGVQILHLSLSARLDIEGHDTPFVVRTFDREIAVKVTTMQRIKAAIPAGQWAWGALIVPIIGYLWRRHQKKG
jgi:hypothetical protein